MKDASPRSLSYRLTTALLSFTREVFCRIPEPAAIFLGERTGDLLRILLSGKRRILRENLSLSDLALTGRTEERRFEKRVFRHFGRLGAEFLRLPKLSDQEISERVRVDGLERLRAELAKGRGVLLLTGHIGNWEIALRRLSIEAPGRFHPLIRRIKSPAVNDFVDRHRREFGKGASILADLGPKPLIRALRAGDVLIVLLDQNAGQEEGVFTPFLGRPAATYTSLARLSLLTNLPVFPSVCHRKPDGRFQIRILAPIPPEPDLVTEEAVSRMTFRYSQALSAFVHEHPEQWIWMHRRWKTRPPEELPRQTEKSESLVGPDPAP